LIFIWDNLAKYRLLQVAAMVFVFVCIGYYNTKVLRNTAIDPAAVADYKMGLQLRTLKKEGDLVIVLSKNTGNPLAIFYSKARGWVFPPAGRHAWDVLPETETECITILEDLRNKGADWFAINREHYKTFQTSYPKFERHLTSHYPLRAAQPDFVIFQLQPGNK
jgi:ribosome biogenesis GTPase A